MISDAFENETAKKVKLQNILTQLRKCVDHPYLFDGEWGSALPPHRSLNSLSLKPQQGVPLTVVCPSARCASHVFGCSEGGRFMLSLLYQYYLAHYAGFPPFFLKSS